MQLERLKGTGLLALGKALAVAIDDDDKAWEFLEPLVLVIEQLQNNTPRGVAIAEYDPDSLVNPQYAEHDKTKRIIDAYIWLAEEFRRVVNDHETGTTLDFNKAAVKPPTIFAVQLCEEYARAEPGSPQRKKMGDDIQRAIGKLPKNSTGIKKIAYAGDL